MKLLPIIFLMLNAQQSEIPMRDEDAFIKNFDKVSESTTSIQCNFEQNKYISISKNPLTSSGKLYFEDEKMRWDQKIPKDYVMCINDDILKIKEDGKVKEHSLGENKYMKGLREIMVGSMTGNLLKSDQFETKLMENSEHWIVNLIPKVKRVRKMFTRIKMKFNRLTYRMEEVILTESNGDYTVIIFRDPIFNKDVPDELFNL
jgi:outer membrane lipoprotein-sorting protein